MLAGFYLLRVYDMPSATVVAVALNVGVACLAWAISGVTAYAPAALPPGEATPAAPEARLVYVAIALSGLTALGAEVVWTRVLSLLFGATTYTFSLILAVFLVGLGIGSTVGSELARRVGSARAALGWCQLGLCATMAWAAVMTGESLPYWPIDPSMSTDPSFNLQLDLMRAIWVMLPATLLWGASFSLALGAVASRGQDPGRLVGGVYAANTVGAIVGALATGLVLVGTVGSQVSQQLLIGVAAVSALLMLVGESSRAGAGGGFCPAGATAVVLSVCVAVVLLVGVVPPLPGLLVAYGRYAATWVGINEIVYVGEGVTAVVAVSRTSDGALNYHNAGKVQASSEPQDMRLQRMLGHMTTLVPRNPARVLVIGCGAGVTAGAVSIDPLVKDETIAEIEPLVPEVVSTYFAEHNFDVVRNPKVRILLDDARHYLLTTRETFDAITSDPLDPWVKGAATLYTREFFEVVKRHLNPGGVVTLLRAAVREHRGRREERDSHVSRGVSRRRRVREYSRRDGLRPRVVRPARQRPHRRRRRPGQALGAGWRADQEFALADRNRVGRRTVRHLRGEPGRHGRVADERSDQSGFESATIVSGGAGAELLSERGDLQEHDREQPVPRAPDLPGRRRRCRRCAIESSGRWRCHVPSSELHRAGRAGGAGYTTVPGAMIPPFGTTMMPPRMQ